MGWSSVKVLEMNWDNRGLLTKVPDSLASNSVMNYSNYIKVNLIKAIVVEISSSFNEEFLL